MTFTQFLQKIYEKQFLPKAAEMAQKYFDANKEPDSSDKKDD